MTAKSPESLISRPDFQLLSSRGFIQWLADTQLSVAVTTYHVGGMIMLGTKPDGSAAVHVAAFDRSMGSWTDGQTMWLVTEQSVWRLENDLADGQVDDNGYDRVFVPRVGYTTGEVDGHELSVDSQGRPLFVNTAFSCLATVDERRSFRPLWKPPFISELVPEDRCHLSGLAMSDGEPRFVTMHARSDVADGWRDFRDSGGLVIDVRSDEIYATGLSMPHSPRVVEGRLWLLNSGTGHLGYIDPVSQKFEEVAFVPGYARGLAIYGGYAVVGLSKPRREHAFQGLPLQKNLEARGAASRCGLQLIDLTSGAVVHWVRIESEIEELFDVAVLPGVRRPKALSFASTTYARQFSFEYAGKLRRCSLARAVLHDTHAGKDNPSTDPLAMPEALRSDAASNRRSAKSLNNLGLSKALAGEFVQARDYFEQAVALDPTHAGAYNNLGNVLREQGDLDRAIQCYGASVAADPTYGKAYFNLGRVLRTLGRSAEAAAAFSRGLRIDPNNVDAAIGLAEALAAQGKYEDALRCYRQVLTLAPESWHAYTGMGLLQRERGDLEAAIMCFEQSLSIDPCATAFVNLGTAFADAGRTDEARECYINAIAIDPNCVSAQRNFRLLAREADAPQPDQPDA
ncbi:MAG: TIGR03032 family protein [Planctomycetales bacterium]|nr:TIGR03032 family protein [Planctomycetales bacterium]